MKRVLLIVVLALSAVQARAARPFVTDDARLTTAGSCQLESWMRVYPDSREIWALPACNPSGNLEFTVGGGRAKNDGQRSVDDYVFQAKTLFRQMESNDWGWGLAIGTVRHPEISPGPNLLGNTYAYVPMSASFNNDRAIMHANIGWLKDRSGGTNNMTWGLGGEFAAAARFTAIAEVFGDNHKRPYWQGGGRFSIVPDKVQVDATVGRQFAGLRNTQWLSFGLRLTPDRLF